MTFFALSNCLLPLYQNVSSCEPYHITIQVLYLYVLFHAIETRITRLKKFCTRACFETEAKSDLAMCYCDKTDVEGIT